MDIGVFFFKVTENLNMVYLYWHLGLDAGRAFGSRHRRPLTSADGPRPGYESRDIISDRNAGVGDSGH